MDEEVVINILTKMFQLAPFVIVGLGIFIMVVIELRKIGKKRNFSKEKNNAQSFFEKESGAAINTIDTTENSPALIEYLKSILEKKEEKNIVIDASESNEKEQSLFQKKSLTFLKFKCDDESIDILSDPDNLKQTLKTISFADIDKIILKFKSFSVRRGSGKNSRTDYLNQYSTILKFKSEASCADVTIYDKVAYVSFDQGYFEVESRAIGELFAKIFKTNLVRIDGTEIEYTKLDESVTEKLKNFVKSNYSFKKEMFIVEDLDNNGASISKLQYYNVPKIVLGIILLSIIDIVGPILFFKTQPIGKELGFFHNVGVFILIEMLFGLIIFLWVKNSKYKMPKLKPIVHLYKDKIFTDLKIRNGELVSKNEVLVSEIEGIEVRYEVSMGYSVKLISDDFSVRVVSYNDVQKANYVRDEILNTLKKLS